MSELFTLVQHSAWTYKRDPQFRAAVETRAIPARSREKIERAGGVVYTSFAAADEAEMAANYPDPKYGGIIPQVRGHFDVKIDYEGALYIPEATQ